MRRTAPEAPRSRENRMLEVIRSGRHHLGGGFHQTSHRPRQIDAASLARGVAVNDFVGAHLLENGARLSVLGR